MSASRDFSERCSCTKPTERSELSLGEGRGYIYTSEDDHDSDTDADRIIHVAHDSADNRASAKEKDKRTLIEHFGEFEEKWFRS